MISEPDTLEEVGNFMIAELEVMPLAELNELMQRVSSAEESARQYKQFLQAVMHHRFGIKANQLRQDAGKTTGVVRFEDDGFVVISDLPKRPEYDQRKLKEAVDALRRWGEDPRLCGHRVQGVRDQVRSLATSCARFV